MRLVMAAAALALAAIVASCSSTPTAAPTAAPAPATTPAAATTAPPAPVAYVPQTVTGNGATVVDLTTPIQLGVMTLDCSRCRGQVTVKTDAEIDSDLVYVSNGKYVGKRWLGVRGGTTSRIQVTATGPWELTVTDASSVKQYPAGATVSGDGDDVVLFTTGPRTADVTHKDPQGYNHFAVQVAMDGLVVPALPVNVTGSFSGTVMFPGNGTNAALMQVKARGSGPSSRVRDGPPTSSMEGSYYGCRSWSAAGGC